MLNAHFNPRSHERSDLPFGYYIIKILLISIHAPTRGATNHALKQKRGLIFQSTLPREERPYLKSLSSFSRLFQSTLPREERLRADRVFKTLLYFNPRSHERSDDSTYKLDGLSYISIHAPTRGATKSQALKVMRFGFQSTLPREERHNLTPEVMQWKSFQSTLPREERLKQWRVLKRHYNFNPRSHERSDHDRHVTLWDLGISIHAPTRGATIL